MYTIMTNKCIWAFKGYILESETESQFTYNEYNT